MSRTLPVECGVNRLLIRSTRASGQVVLKAEGAGLKPVSLEILSQPAKILDGWSREMPDAGLPAYLARGATPPAMALTVWRRPAEISSVEAGSNASTAGQSVDDNEVTSWASDGRVDTAWIAYTLAQPTRLNEVTMKLGTWRTRAYPIRIRIDGRVVFEGNTTPSLGYVTIAFPPTQGRRLRLEMTGPPRNVDSMGKIIGVLGNQDVDAKNRDNAVLNIVELEIYRTSERGRPR